MYCMLQPPWEKPPLVSSSSPPGAWATPSRLRNSLTTTLRMSISFRSGSLGGRRRCAAKVIGSEYDPHDARSEPVNRVARADGREQGSARARPVSKCREEGGREREQSGRF